MAELVSLAMFTLPQTHFMSWIVTWTMQSLQNLSFALQGRAVSLVHHMVRYIIPLACQVP